MEIERFPENPLVTPETDDSIGTNVNGPSVIRAPEWLPDRLGEYYLYFAGHHGSYVRLAYADDLRGPWTVHPPGTLHIGETMFDGSGTYDYGGNVSSEHVASPDVHVDDREERLRMYYHGCCGPFEVGGLELPQVTCVATSTDGIAFDSRDEPLGNSYFRVFEHGGAHYAIANDGYLYRSPDPLTGWGREGELYPRNRHFAVRFSDPDTLQVFLTRRGDRPERIMVSTMDLDSHYSDWEPTEPETVLEPERDYEGANEPLEESEAGAALEPVRQLRDPAIYEEDGRTYLFYAVAGERGIAGAEITF